MDAVEGVSDVAGDFGRLVQGVASCPEEMEQALQDKGREQDAVWDAAKAPAGWAVRLPPVPAGIVFVRVVDIGYPTWRASHAISKAVPSAAAP